MGKTKTIDVNQLLGAFQNLKTFQEVADWDNEAEIAIKAMAEKIEKIDQQVPQKQKQLLAANVEHKQIPFFKRIITSNKVGSSLRLEIATFEKEKAELELAIEELQSRVDTTPNTKQEQKILLKELRHRKKKLQEQKREVATEMRAVREESRRKSANANFSALGLIGKTSAQRRMIRLNKESALRPHENERDSIERQIALLEKQIRWADRFHEGIDEGEVEEIDSANE